jgi:hypothetical protein
MKRSLFFFSLLFTLVLVLISPKFALAQGVVPQVDIENVEVSLGDKLTLRDGSQVQEVFNSADDMVNLLIKVVFVGAGMVLFFMIVGAGFAMITGGSDDKGKAKTTMTTALIGFLIMFSAYWIMQIIQLITGIDMNF